MFTITIGGLQRSSGELTESWVNQQVNKRRREGKEVCVRLSVNGITLTSCGCPPTGGRGGGTLSRMQKRIIQLWRKHGLDECEFTGGNVVAFLKQLSNIA